MFCRVCTFFIFRSLSLLLYGSVSFFGSLCFELFALQRLFSLERCGIFVCVVFRWNFCGSNTLYVVIALHCCMTNGIWSRKLKSSTRFFSSSLNFLLGIRKTKLESILTACIICHLIILCFRFFLLFVCLLISTNVYEFALCLDSTKRYWQRAGWLRSASLAFQLPN